MSFSVDKRVVLYPHYITKSKTVQDGRRIPKELACDNPNVMEMLECLKELQIPAVIEDKHYPRDWFIRGRLRVQLKKDDGSPTNPAIPDRRTLMIKIAELQPKHKRPMPQGLVIMQQAGPSGSKDDSAKALLPSGGKSGGKGKGKGKK